jgi:DNA-binding IclR family transcriptional regulator
MSSYRFVTYYATQRAWGLGTAAFELGSAYLRTEPLARLGTPVLAALAAQTGETAHLGILRGADVMILRRKRPAGQEGSFVTEEGVRVPAHLTSLGRAMLMELSDSQFRALYRTEALLSRRTGRGPVLVTDLRKELSESRGRGYAVDDGLLSPGTTCIGAPVFSHENQPLAAVSITFLSSKHPQPEWSGLAVQVKDAALRLSRALGWDSAEPRVAGKPPVSDRRETHRVSSPALAV